MSQQQKSDFPIVGSFHADFVTKINSERSINWHEVIHPYGKKPRALHPTPGTQIQTSIGVNDGPVRGAFVFNDIAYFCSNDSLYQMDAAYMVSPISLAAFTTTSGFVRIVSNQTQVAFVDGLTGVLWDTVSVTASPIVFPVGVIPTDITYMHGYFIIVDKITNRFYISALNDGTMWAALDFAALNIRASFGVGCQVLKNRLFLFSQNITAAWMDAGDAQFPFRPDNNVVFEHGLAAVGTLVEDFDLMFYLSRDDNGVGSIKMVDGAYPVSISTYEIDNVIQQFTIEEIEAAVGMVYKMNGIVFYKITIGDRTFVYNVTMSSQSERLWHEEQMANGSRHLANTHVFFNNLHFVGDYLSAKLYLYSTLLFKNRIEDGVGEPIHRERITRAFSDENYRLIRVDRIQVDMLQGVGTPGTDNTDMESLNLYRDSKPFLQLSKSTDGGVTYINLGSAEIGRIGNRRHRTIFSRCGVEREYIFKFESFASVPLYILGGAIWFEVLYE